MSKTGATWTFTYDANGMRTSRSSQYTTYEYVYNGGKLMQMTSQGTTAGATAYVFNFFYDASGVPTSFTLNGATYYYVTNLQGDVVAIVDSSGVKTASYSYDAWGNVTFKKGSGTNSNFITYYNPLLYRSYVYDQESGLYYLQSRYYDPEIGRFINADGYPTTGQGLTGNNMFAYCGNNPVSREDDGGEFWNFVVGAVVGAVIATVSTAVDAVKEDGWDAFKSGKTWAKMGVSAVCGAINGTVAASGAHTIVGGLVGGATGFIESWSHEMIDNDGELSEASWNEIKADTAVGFLGGLSGGKGAIYKNKYMSQQGSRFLKHLGQDGFKKASSFYYKMTANYSKQFIKPTLSGLAKGWVGGKVADRWIV